MEHSCGIAFYLVSDMRDSYDIFISYSHLDSEWVKDWLVPRLEAAGLSVCIDYSDFEIGRLISTDNSMRGISLLKLGTFSRCDV